MLESLLTLSLLCSQASPSQLPPILFTPASAIDGAYHDALRLRQAGQDTQSVRYLSCYQATTPEEIQDLGELSDFVLNSLNFSKRSLVVCPRLEAGRLLRVDLLLLGMDPKTWDRLGREGSGPAPYPEPYFHQRLEGLPSVQTQTVETIEKRWYPGGYENGKFYTAGYYDYKIKKTIQVPSVKGNIILAQAAWLPKTRTIELVQWLGTEYPVLRCDWFCVYALQPPAYVHFQGDPKKLQDFQDLAGVDPKAKDRTASQLRGAVLVSEVASRNRFLERTPTGTNYGRGYYWESFDYFTAIQQNDLLKNLLFRKRDAGEIIWGLPNGLQGYGLVNGQAATIEFADPRVAIDNRTLLRDKVVWTGWKCIFCHADGIIPITDEVRLSSRDTLGFLIPDKKEAERVADVYFGEEINRLVINDQLHYAASVQGLTRKAPATISLQYQKLHQRYTDEPVTVETVCIDTGYPESAVRPLLAMLGTTGLDHHFVRMLRERKGRRDQHEVAFASLMQVLALVKEKQ